MRSFFQRWAGAPAALAAGFMLALAGCLSAPKSSTGATATVATSTVAIDHIAQRYLAEENFKRISEYFTGRENKSGRVIERTDPKQRTGYYFIVDLAWHPGVVLPAGTRAELQYIRSDNPAPRTAEFTFSSATGTWPEIYLGLTGADWPQDEFTITAYKLTLEDAQGRVLAERQSFLWALPDAVTPAVASTPAAPATAAAPSNP
jgi:hypothetical protein